MSIRDLNDWGSVELKAQTHELSQVDSPKVPTPTQAQYLAWATQRCAELQAKIHRMQGKALECQMWIQAGDSVRAQQAINEVILDL